LFTITSNEIIYNISFKNSIPLIGLKIQDKLIVDNMISVTEAWELISKNTVALKPVRQPLLEAAGKVLAEDVYAAVYIPGFNQSSMDGYAFSFSDLKINKNLKISGEMAAGTNALLSVLPGNAVRIFTGAPLPIGADTVVIQEKTRIENDLLIVEDDNLQQGSNVRLKGTDIRTGDMALSKETLLTPAAVGFLAGIGITNVLVYPNPLVSIIVTGNELQQPGQPLSGAQVYESNSFMLSSALHHGHIDAVNVYYVNDNLETLTGILKNALEQSDVIFLTGGISAGDYDFVLKAAENCGVTKIFHKIKQRPGKPLYFGIKGNKIVFGLPGNPSSVLTCFYEYVLPAFDILTKQKFSLPKMKVPLLKPFSKTIQLTHFLKGFYDGTTVTVLNAQESYRLSSFAKANCLVKIDEEAMQCKEGELVEIHLLPS
jgi:molybdopterin molybdotransferase